MCLRLFLTDHGWEPCGRPCATADAMTQRSHVNKGQISWQGKFAQGPKQTKSQKSTRSRVALQRAAVQRIALPLSKTLVSLLRIDPQSIWKTGLGFKDSLIFTDSLGQLRKAVPGRIAPCRSCPRPSPGGCAAKNNGQASAVAAQAFCTLPTWLPTEALKPVGERGPEDNDWQAGDIYIVIYCIAVQL
ncbi:hypothetical protein G3M48_005572 [Beauveria asiatica]|uniref:Uncharacterized protein n=1 Tax=Beauveria asiatica TaxID=1069075 RepID=A0AAW0RS04_9HYPO